MATLSAFLTDLSGSLREKGAGGLTRFRTGDQQLGGSARSQDDGGVKEEEMGEVLSPGWRDRAFRSEEASSSWNSG